MDDEFGIYFQPQVAGLRVSSALSRVIWRAVSLVISVTVFSLMWVFFPDVFGAWAPWFLAAAGLTGGGTTLFAVIGWLRIRSDARRVSPGLAIGLNRAGMLIGGRWITWPEVGAMTIRPGTWGASSRLITYSRDGSAVPLIPLALTDAMPASLDSVVRVLSSGRSWVDMSALD